MYVGGFLFFKKRNTCKVGHQIEIRNTCKSGHQIEILPGPKLHTTFFDRSLFSDVLTGHHFLHCCLIICDWFFEKLKCSTSSISTNTTFIKSSEHQNVEVQSILCVNCCHRILWRIKDAYPRSRVLLEFAKNMFKRILCRIWSRLKGKVLVRSGFVASKVRS